MSKRNVYIDDEWAKKIEDAQSDESKLSVINEFIDSTKRSYRLDYQSLQEDVLMYKALMLETKKAFKEASEEHVKGCYELWENFDKEISGLKTKTSSIVQVLNPVKKEIETIKQSLDSISLWQIKELLDIVEKISMLSGNNNDMIKFLLNNYKKEQI